MRSSVYLKRCFTTAPYTTGIIIKSNYQELIQSSNQNQCQLPRNAAGIAFKSSSPPFPSPPTHPIYQFCLRSVYHIPWKTSVEKDCKFFDLPRSLTGKYYTGSAEVFHYMSKIPWKRDTCKISRYVTRNNGFSEKN